MKPDGYKLNALEQEYIERSKRFKLMILYAILLAIITIVLVILTAGIYSNYARLLAVEQRDRADSLRVVADSNAADAERERLVAVRARDSANLERRRADSARDAEEKARIQAEKERENARLAALEARRQEMLAKIQRNIAERRRIYAELKEQEADSARQVAEEKTREAYGYLVRQTARAMAIKSLQIEDPDLRTSLVLQAWLFHKNYGGDAYNADIYNGLYQALVQQQGHKWSNYEGVTGALRELEIQLSDGSIITGGEEGKILQWYPKPLNQKRVIASINGLVNSLDISPDGEFLAFGASSHTGLDPTLGLLKQTERGWQILQFTGSPTSEIWDVKFSGDSQSFLYCDADKNLYRLSLGEKFPQKEIIRQFEKDLVELELSTDGNYLAALDEEGTLHFMDGKTGESVALPFQKEGYFSIAFSPKTNWLALGSTKDVILFDPVNQDTSLLLGYDKDVEIKSLAYSPDGNLLATGASNGDISLWSLESLGIHEVNKQLPVSLYDEAGNSWVLSLAFSPDSKTLYAGYNDIYHDNRDVNKVPSQLKSWSIELNALADRLSPYIRGNLNKNEWEIYVGSMDKIKYEATRDTLLKYNHYEGAINKN